MFNVTHLKTTYAAWNEGDDEREIVDTELYEEPMTFKEVQELLSNGNDWQQDDERQFTCTNDNNCTIGNIERGEDVIWTMFYNGTRHFKHWQKLKV